MDNYEGAFESGEPPPTEDGFTAMSELSSESILAIQTFVSPPTSQNRKASPLASTRVGYREVKFY
jgi:hypothetical protein